MSTLGSRKILQIGVLLQGILSDAFLSPIRRSHEPLILWSSSQEQGVEALRSLVDFHEGRWKGKARSFSVVPDTAAGIVQRKTSPEYEISVKFGGKGNRNDYSLTETFSWDEGKIKPRSLLLSECNLDVDVVDASYSLDVSLPDLPSDIVGTDELSQFAIEHCISASEDKRMRCFVLYCMDQKLQRVVVCEETRVVAEDTSNIQTQLQSASQSPGSQLTVKDLLEMENDVDRLVDKITLNMKTGADTSSTSPKEPSSKSNQGQVQLAAESLFEKLGQSMSSSDDNSRKLTLHDLSLLELSSGVWLGDAIVRNNPQVPDGTISQRSGSGFGAEASLASSKPTKQGFASWSVGVQKLAWRLMWNFGEEIRQVVDAGKALGDNLAACLMQSTGGSVCVNESLSRRMAKEDRMVYIDWAASNSVGFLVGPVYLYVPRYLNFEQKGSNPKPFYTEFAFCQSTSGDSIRNLPPPNLGSNMDEESLKFPDLCLSKSSRVYNHEGRLKQGCTSFYTFKRFGVDDVVDG
jgi:hypothetical protein